MSSKKHMTEEMRIHIESGIVNGASAQSIARGIGVSASTVTREVLKNRTITEKKSKHQTVSSLRCVHKNECEQLGTACKKCSTQLTLCKNCRTRDCTMVCSKFELVMCPLTTKWPYVCPSNCCKRRYCSYPKCSYSASRAHKAYQDRLSESRSGIAVEEDELAFINNLICPLIKKGQSFEAIWATHKDELPISMRSAYTYQELGVLGIKALEMPQKVRRRPRKRTKPISTRTRVDRTGRTYDDFLKLSFQEQASVVQIDSVEGFDENKQDVLSMHLVALSFQLYVLKNHSDPQSTVAALDDVEKALGSPEAFSAVFGILLADRGVEFDDWEGMERSCLIKGVCRCHVFYCDAQATNQKSQCERNHQRLRRILPKGRSNFDALSKYDVSLCCSHVNSYPLPTRGGKCPFELASGLLPQDALSVLSIERIAPDDVILKPYLMPHVVEQ